MLRGLLIFLATCASATLFAEKPLSDVEQIKALVPAQTAMGQEEFEVIAKSSSIPRERDIPNKSLTWVLLTLEPNRFADTGDQFRFLTEEFPKPSELTQEMYRTIGAGDFRIPTAPVTMIQAERITKLEVDIHDGRATGSFEFKVPKLYEGKADFVAHRNGDEWSINELMMPKLKIHIVRDTKGVWLHKEAGQEPEGKPE